MPAPTPCHVCGAALTPLQARGGRLCARHASRPGPADAHPARDDALARRRTHAAALWHDDTVAHAPVLWIPPHPTRRVPLPGQRRQSHLDHLAALAATLSPSPSACPPEPDATTAHDAPMAASLCGFCAGRCCRWGAEAHAFITADVLRRWLARHPGHTPRDAADAYGARLPAQHIEDSCAHHDAQGCTLPREMRADICNQYTCAGVNRLSTLPGAGSAVLAAQGTDEALHDAALLRTDGLHPLPP